MKIIDTFQFSESFEKELLLIKLNLGRDVVSEWLICENAYTHQGNFKGHGLRQIIENDDRFSQFLDRIRIFEGNRQGISVGGSKGVNDEIAISNEVYQRELSLDYILENYSEEDFVLLSDCDECPDFSNPIIRDVIFKKLYGNRTGIAKAPRIRFWYDVDNLWREQRATPFVKVGFLKGRQHDLCRLRYSNLIPDPSWKKPVVFEYSFNFSKEAILRKYSSFIHTGYLKEEIILGIECNHLPISSLRNQNIDLSDRWWLKKVDLEWANAPRYVKENYQQIRTGTVDPNYIENRYLYYPQFYSRRIFSFATYNRIKVRVVKCEKFKELANYFRFKFCRIYKSMVLRFFQ